MPEPGIGDCRDNGHLLGRCPQAKELHHYRGLILSERASVSLTMAALRRVGRIFAFSVQLLLTSVVARTSGSLGPAATTTFAISDTATVSASATPTQQNASSIVQVDVIRNFCARFMHQSTIKGNTLYIDGGLETFVDITGNGTQLLGSNHKITEGYNLQLIAVDLAKAWDWQVSLPQVALNKTSNAETGALPPQVRSGALFSGLPDDNKIYLYGGTTDWWNFDFPVPWPTSRMYVLWSYDTSTRAWSQYDVSSESPFRPSNGISTTAPDLGLGFYLNGEIDSGSSLEDMALGDNTKIFLEGMIVVNTTNQSVMNISTNAWSGSQPHTRGGATYIPHLAGNGILIVFGGTYKQANDVSKDETANYVAMDQIDVFDIGAYRRNDTTLWYRQNATGDIPLPRTYFCTVLASALDNTTHNIYMYSGSGENDIFDDIYVLSIPSFIWTKINSGTSPRYGHTCHIVGDQMLTVGGMNSYDFNSTCDWERKSVAIFNISSEIWGSRFVPENETAAYSMSERLQTAIKGYVVFLQSLRDE